MLIVVSPAKRLNEQPATAIGGSEPAFLSQARILVERAGELAAGDLQKLMHISPKLAALNVERFSDFATGKGAKQAVELFSGDTYTGLEAGTLGPDERAYAQDHLRILSGLYGLLRPQDMIQPHRLEMGSRLANARGKNLYEFWGDRIARALNRQADALGTDVLINCASVEYFSAVDPKALKLRVITPAFLEHRDGEVKVMAFFAKKARGAMARFIIQQRVTNPDGLKDFDAGGYRFTPELSHGDRWAFVRPYPEPASNPAGP